MAELGEQRQGWGRSRDRCRSVARLFVKRAHALVDRLPALFRPTRYYHPEAVPAVAKNESPGLHLQTGR
jgi:hypothetical protein